MDFVSHSNPRLSGAAGRKRQNYSALLLRVSLIFVLFFTLNVQAAASQEGNPPSPSAPMPTWNPIQVDAPLYYKNMTSRALSYRPDGRPCAAFGGDGLYYSCYISPTGWTVPTVIDNNIGVGEYASLAEKYIPYTGEIRSAITYFDSYNGKLKLAYTDGGVWQTPVTVPTPFSLKPALKIEKGMEPTFDDEILKLTQPWMSILKEADPKIVFDTVGVGKHNSVALDSVGAFHISYYDENDASLNYAYWDGATWSFELVDDYIDIGKGVGKWSSIQVDNATNVHIAYMDEKYDNLKYAYKNHTDGEWTTVTVDNGGSNNFNVGSMCSLALDSAGDPYISYLDFSLGNLKIAELVDWHPMQWDIDVVDTTGYTGWWSSIYVDSSNKAHISYYNATSGDLRYAYGAPGGSWLLTTLQPTIGNVGMFTSIAWDALHARPIILYYNSSAGWLMFISKSAGYNNTRWNTPAIVAGNSNDVGLASSLSVNSDGVPFISYQDVTYGLVKYTRGYYYTFPKYYPNTHVANGLFSSIKVYDIDKPQMALYDVYHGDLLYGKWTGSYWSYKTVDGRNDVGQYNSLAINQTGPRAGAPSISYYNATYGDLMYAYWDIGLTHWFTYTLDDVGNVGRYTSLALNSSDIPFISYYDETNGDLKLKYQTPLHIWAPAITVDGDDLLDEDVGMYNSLALDSAGNPHISYFDYTNNDLKYAYWKDGSFPTTGSWDISTLHYADADPDLDFPPEGDDVGRFTSLKIYQADNTRHMCFYDLSNKWLVYARYLAGDTWKYLKVDSGGDVGMFCSLDLNGLGEPAISYYDNYRGDLKLALSYELPLAKFYIPVVTKEDEE